MLGLHMLYFRLLGVEQAIAIPAVVVIGTLPVVLVTRIGAPKVEIAIIARPVGIGILFVLLQCPVTCERSFTAITIRHRIIVVQSEEGDVSFKPDIKIYINCIVTVPVGDGRAVSTRNRYSPGGTYAQARRTHFALCSTASGKTLPNKIDKLVTFISR
jgi:hypothetical protein